MDSLVFQTQPTPTDYVALTFLSLVGATLFSRGILWDRPDPYRHLLFERPQLKNANNGSQLAGSAQQTRNIARRLEETNSSIVVFWGSQSGTAESFAHRLSREITLRFGQHTLTADLSDFDPVSIAEIPASKLAIFILSTYGDGDPSDNTIEFWDWLNSTTEKKRSDLFRELKYFAFGLGNSHYKFYNRVVDRVVELLDSYGANALLPVSRADDANGSTQEDFIAWKETLFAFFRDQLGFKQSELVYRPTLAITHDATAAAAAAAADALHRGEPRHSPSPVAIPVTAIRELFASTSDRHCLHIDLDISAIPDVVYKTGDHLAVWPSNPDEEVSLLLRVLGREDEADTPLSIAPIASETDSNTDADAGIEKDNSDANKIPSPTTLLVLLRHYLEITAPIPRDVLSTLATFAPSAEAKSLLTSLAEDKEVYAAFTRKNHITLGRILHLASSSSSSSSSSPSSSSLSTAQDTWTNLPISYLIETLPALQPRYYSISSSSVVSPRKPSLTVLVVSSQLPENPSVSIPGLTSTYLHSLSHPSPSTRTYTPSIPTLTCNTTHLETHPETHPEMERDTQKNKKILAHLRRSPFKLPRLPSTPLILIAAGTGLAPFRAFLAERKQLLKIGREVGDVLLFFGCRRPDEDYIYAAEIEEMRGVFGGGLRVVNAFSRDSTTTTTTTSTASVAVSGEENTAGKKRVYVQDRVVEYRETVADMMLEKGASLYICGRAGMAREVEKRVTGFLAEMKGWTEKGAEEWVRGVKRRKKWQEDVWG